MSNYYLIFFFFRFVDHVFHPVAPVSEPASRPGHSNSMTMTLMTPATTRKMT